MYPTLVNGYSLEDSVRLPKLPPLKDAKEGASETDAGSELIPSGNNTWGKALRETPNNGK